MTTRVHIRNELAKNIEKNFNKLMESVMALKKEIEENHAQVRVLNKFDSEFHDKVESVREQLSPARNKIGSIKFGYANRTNFPRSMFRDDI